MSIGPRPLPAKHPTRVAPSMPAGPGLESPSGQITLPGLETLFDRAVAGGAETRAGVLAAAGAADPELADELAGLLAAHDDLVPADGPAEVRRVGPYELVERLGEGAFGVVWRARQERPFRREVALKLIKPGMDSEAVLARFAQERQALARLEHPGIARVLDAGVTERGRPFVAMERVDGEPITRFCDRHRLPVEDRVRLLRSVCLALQHAHQKGVIHRDIKPSNVLVACVDGEARASIIDFGVARALSADDPEATRLTGGQQLVGTPGYMAPEQMVDAAVADTRADVHGLGALLHELLAGSPPVPADASNLAPAELLCRLRTEAPRLPSQSLGSGRRLLRLARRRRCTPARLRHRLRGDLDRIVARALERDPERRYAGATALANDLQRWLERLPVEAAAPSRLRSLQRMVARHRGMCAAAVAVFGALVAGLVGTSLALDEAHRNAEALAAANAAVRAEAAHARASARRADAVFRLFADSIAAADPHQRRSADFRVRDMLAEVQRELDAGGQPAEVEATLRSLLAGAYRSLGLIDEAGRNAGRALALRAAPDRVEDMADAADLWTLAWVAHDRQQFVQALATMHRSLALARELGSPDDLAARLGSIAEFEAQLGRHDDALEHAREAERMFGDVRASRATAGGLALARKTAGVALVELGDGPAGLEKLRAALAGLRELPVHDELTAAGIEQELGVQLHRAGHHAEGLEHVAAALAVHERLLEAGHPRTARCRQRLATIQRERGDMVAARAGFRRAHAELKAAIGEDKAFTRRALHDLAVTTLLVGELDEARTLFVELRAVRDRCLPPGHVECIATAILQSEVERRAGEHDAAVARARDAVALARAHHEPHVPVRIAAEKTLQRLLSGQTAKLREETR